MNPRLPSKTRPRSRFVAAALLASVFGSACQSASLDRTRRPASVPDPQLVALVKTDALEAVGLYAHHVLLGLVAHRLRVDQTLVRVPEIRFDSSSVATGLVLTPLLGASAGSSANTESGHTRVTTAASIGSGAAIALVGTFGIAADHYGEKSSSSSFGDLAPEQNSFAWIQRKLRPQAARRHAEKKADYANAEKTTAFQAQLKEVAIEVARRSALLFRLSAMEIAQLELKTVDAIARAFRAKDAWRAGEEFRIDIPALLRAVVPDADQRIAALGKIVDPTNEQERVILPETSADVAAWLEACGAEIRTFEKHVVDSYRSGYSDADPRAKAIRTSYVRLAADLDEFAKKLETHARIVRASMKKGK